MTVQTVLVVGMHRSGTSLVTRLIMDLGVNPPNTGDLGVGRATNPANERGFWEPRLLVEANERLLWTAGGGGWSAPPDLEIAWDRLPGTERARRRYARLLRRHQRSRPWVWKDPRLCITAPFWMPMLAPEVAIALVHRRPDAVADSLGRRDGFPAQLGLALWEAYNAAALKNARGTPLLVIDYDRIVDQPDIATLRIRQWLAELGVCAGAGRSPIESVDARLRRAGATVDDESSLNAEQRQLAAVLQSMSGVHADENLSLPRGLSSRTRAALSDRRQAIRSQTPRRSRVRMTRRWMTLRAIEALKRL